MMPGLSHDEEVRRQKIKSYCSLCIARCGSIATVEGGRFVALEPDPSHPTGQALCAKGRASPELVYSPDRLLYPLRRMRPKGDPDPGWQRISWDEALDMTASAMQRIATRAQRPDGLVMPACIECNNGTSTADLAVALISRWSAISTPQEQKDHAKFAHRVLKQAPLLREEWLSIVDDPVEQHRARQHLIDHGVNVPADASLATIGPETIGQLNLFAHKVILGLYFHHFRRGLPARGRVCAYWRTKEDFARKGVPQIFFDMLPNYRTIAQGQWDERKTFEYRFAIGAEEGVFGCLARFRASSRMASPSTIPPYCPMKTKQSG
jgi:Molybdopterin oxidoreductase Fe4S4 domain/Molybdopterin oxidoreductase